MSEPAEQYRCMNCGLFFSVVGTWGLPMFCPGCEDYEEWKREEGKEPASE